MTEGHIQPITEIITGNELKRAFESFEIASQKLSGYYKNLEDEIKDLKGNLNTVLESLPLGVIITDGNNIVKFINKSLSELIPEYDLVNYLDRSIDDFLNFFFNDGALNHFIKPIFNPIEKMMKVGCERVIPVFLYVKNINTGSKKNSGRIFIIQNIEEIKKFKRLAELGEMSAKIAHEIRNPLGSIELFASILQKDLKDKDKEHLEIISHIISAVKNMNTTINNVLEFSKIVKPAPSKCNLLESINKSIIYASYIIKQKNIKIIREIDGDISAEIDENLIEQAFINILANAAHAAPNNYGTIDIKSSILLLDNESSYICINFEDNGPGFSKDIIKNIFNPFFSTKKSGGTGLGLSIALNNVMIHGGYINADNSEKLGGAKISVFLPYLA